MRLIDTDKLKFPNIAIFDMKLHGVTVPMVRLIDLQMLMPTVDAAPVKHGRWMEQHVDYASDCAIDEIQELKCSACGLYHTAPYMYNITHYKFCPNCGARMDLEEQDAKEET